MNGNAVGATTLAYMKGERDLLVERRRLSRIPAATDPTKTFSHLSTGISSGLKTLRIVFKG